MKNIALLALQRDSCRIKFNELLEQWMKIACSYISWIRFCRPDIWLAMTAALSCVWIMNLLLKLILWNTHSMDTGGFSRLTCTYVSEKEKFLLRFSFVINTYHDSRQLWLADDICFFIQENGKKVCMTDFLFDSILNVSGNILY